MFLSNSFETGQPNGTTITPVNAGGAAGNAPDSLSPGSGATAVFSTTSPIMGSLSGVFTTPGTGTTSRWVWSSTSLGGTFSRMQFRVQIQPGNLTPSQMPFARWMAGGSQAARITVDTSGVVSFRNKSSTILVSSVGTMTTSDKWTITGDITFGASGSGDIFIYYTGSTSFDEHLTFSAADLLSSAIDEVDLGICATTANASIKMDSIVITDSGTVPGLPTTAGTASAPLGALSASATGSIGINGTAAAPLGAVASSATGTVVTIVTGTASAPLGVVTATASGSASGGNVVFGAATAPLGGITAAATGSIGGLVAGTASAPLGGVTAAAQGYVQVSATASAVLGGVSAAATTVQIRYRFEPPQRKQTVIMEGALRYSFMVSLTVWKDENGAWVSQETPSSDKLYLAQRLLSVSGRPEEVDAATAAELIAAGIGTVTQF